MQIVTSVSSLRQVVGAWRSNRKRIAFVPTMGNLHEGHLRLVATARQHADKVITSIFVNPSQFCAGEDFASYPRTVQEDQQNLLNSGNDCLFIPSIEEVYGNNSLTTVSVTGLANLHCGQSRPGHFDGVATIVCKLFNMVQPDCAVFGLKDFQQFTVIKKMTHDLNLAVDIIGVETVRDAHGLAKSSRNSYLNNVEKLIAPLLFQTLSQTRDAILSGSLYYIELETQALLTLKNAGFKPDYFSICRSNDLQKAQNNDKSLVILTAARLGQARLIDNICFEL